MSLNGNQWQVAMPSQAKSAFKEYVLGENFPHEMYRFFLQNNSMNKMAYLNETTMNNLLKYSNNIDISEKIFVEKRGRIFNRKINNSVIVNEIKGIFELTLDCFEYIWLTVKRWAIKLKAT